LRLVNDVREVKVKRGGDFKKVNMDPVTTPLRDFAMSDPNSVPSSILRPPTEANNSQFNLGLITLFQQEQFGGYPLENPNTHVSQFLDK